MKPVLLASLMAGPALAQIAVPENLQEFYNAVKSGKCSGSDLLKGGFHDTDASDSGEWAYCQQGVAGQAIFIKGNDKFANMDIDCDGNQKGNGPGTRCALSEDTQDQTAFQDTVQTYGIEDLNSNIHPYVVFGNYGNYNPTFDPEEHGIKPLSVMAVVCKDKLVYGIWGDTNGDDGPPLVGEASLATGTACFGDSVNGNNGYDGTDVLYIAFTGDGAVPGKNGANWKASSYKDFAPSIHDLGNKLVAGIRYNGSSSSGGSGSTSSGSCSSCSWAGHCAGASCNSDDDCSGDLTCNGGTCGSPSSCSWAGHCAGASCNSDDDCSDALTCNSGTCG